MILLRCHSGPTRRIHGLDSLQFTGARAAGAFRLLDAIADSRTMPKGLAADYSAALGQAFLVAVLAELALSRGNARPEAALPALVIEAERLARTSLANPQLRVSWLAGSLGCSPDHLSRLFHRHRGITLATWISRERILHAKELLADPTCNISEVGWACGFNGPSYFIKTFQRHVGSTPKAYRLGLLR
jgi:AraC-like DNA-binding protein